MTRSQRARPRSALLGVLSIAFVLLPAVGIAYFGAISYQEDRGLVAAKLDEQYQAAVTAAAAVEGAIQGTLDDLTAIADPHALETTALAAQLARARRRSALAAFPFIISAGGRLLFPAVEPLRNPSADRDDFLARVPRTCPERGFDECIQLIRAAQKRISQLHEARRRELGPCAREPGAPPAQCLPTAKELDSARRSYSALARFDDTGPDALLGLARLAARAGDNDAAVKHYERLSERFGSRLDPDGVSYRLLADIAIAQVRDHSDTWLRLYRSLLAPSYEAPSPMLEQIAEQVRTRLRELVLEPGAQEELEQLDARLAHARDQTLFAAALQGEIEDIARTASQTTRGRPALTAAGRTLIYRARPDNVIIGILVDTAMLEIEARRDVDLELANLAPGTQALIERPGDAVRRAARTRTLASTGFGPILPHLSLSLVHDRALADPLDAIIEARGRRHLAITGGLAVFLVLGLVVTIRGAARERELARLKSDFVSTVSHELKTPLTSIRMFGEMLQQGVAGDDRGREARYHDIIVKESQRLGLLIANLLDYSQIERGTRRYSPHPERAVEIARDAVETFERFREEPSGIRVHVGATDAAAKDTDNTRDIEDAEILVDREVLVQSLLNLLGNAVKYGAPPIDVRVTRQGRDIVLAVTDHGPGISAADRERIFREFYRAPAAYSAGVEGTGLGLALVKRHVEAQGGAVELLSESGRGATFAIRFPRC